MELGYTRMTIASLRFGGVYVDHLSYGNPVSGTTATTEHTIAFSVDGEDQRYAAETGILSGKSLVEFTRREHEYESLGEDVLHTEHRVNGRPLERDLAGTATERANATKKVQFLFHRLTQLPLSTKAKTVFVDPLKELATKCRIPLT
jgi:hypothetical protein